MTKYLKWGIATRGLALVGCALAIGSQWIEPLASSSYSSIFLLIGFVFAFLGVCAGKGMFFFKSLYARLAQEELARIKEERNF